MSRAPLLETGATIDAKYTLVSRLGEGGMGVVFEASTGAGERVALKAIAPSKKSEEAERRARFAREIAVCRQIAHENLMPILDHGVDPSTGTPYFVMPLLEGEDLATVLAREHAIVPEAAIRIVLQACRGISMLHASGIVHRDLKPSNFFLERRGEAVTVRVADFGLAKAGQVSGSLTASNTGLGTPSYMAPEQSASAKHADARADVWALGMVLYHALAGRPAFERPGAFYQYVVDSSRQVPGLQDLAPWIDARVARAVHAALLREPDSRWPDVGELHLGLQMAIGFDASHAPLLAREIVAVPAETRARRELRAVLPSTWHDMLRG